MPQAQVPSPPQWSALVRSQATHVLPLAPQVDRVGALQIPLLQQPSGHENASHRQAPPEQRCPAWQAAPLPQRQAPCTEQVSALVGSQAVQIAAPVPHADSERG